MYKVINWVGAWKTRQQDKHNSDKMANLIKTVIENISIVP